MSELQNSPKRNIFVNQLEKKMQRRHDPSVMFFRRLYRPRNNTWNHVQLAKFLRLKYPILAGMVLTLGFDFAIHMYSDVPQH